MKKNSIYLLLVTLTFLFNLSATAALFPFTATHSGSQEVPANGSTGTGIIRGVYNDVNNTIYYRIDFSGLSSGTRFGHLHAAAPAGVNAPVIYGYTGFPVGVTAGSFIGSNVFTEGEETALKAGLVYSNIHTINFGGGEIRAQINLGPASTATYTFTNAYSGLNEVPPNASTATGTITGTYEPISNTIFYSLNFTGLTGTTVAGHLHAPGLIGVNAPVIYGYRGFPTGVTSGSFTSFNIISEAEELFLTNGQIYSNIHTNVFPGGELRAQIVLDRAPTIICPANISSANDPGTCTATKSFVASTTGFPSPTVTYRVNNVVITSPYAFPVGTTTVTATATNATGTSSCTFTVTVNDNQAPVISGISATPNVLWPPNNKMRDVRVSYSTTDNCGAITCGLTVTSNEGSSSDWQIIDANNVRLRAKRAGNGNGRIYTITATCRDAAGNATSSSTIVTVPHDMGNRSNVAAEMGEQESLTIDVLSNPSTTGFRVNISSEDKIGLMQVRLYNLSGVMVESNMRVRSDQTLNLGNSLRPGVYMLEVRQGQLMEKVKLIKQ